MAKKGIKEEEKKQDSIENKDIKKDKEENIADKNKEIEEVQNSPDVKKKQGRQVIFALILMVAVILIIISTPYVIKNYINKFTYINLDFYKTKMGDITFYSTIVPVTDRHMTTLSDYPMNFRNDPRKLDEIPYIVNATDSVLNDEINDSSLIIFKKFQTVYISMQSDAPKCEDSMIAIVGFTKFLKEFANMSIKAATDNKDYANETGYPYVTCKNYPTNTVIHLVSRNATQMTKITENCYELEYADCEITQITERFELEILKGYMGDFMKHFKKY